MEPISAAQLVGRPVRLHQVKLGRVEDVVLDPSVRRVLGFVVECGDETPRFLPFAASQPAEDEIAVASALMLLDDVGFYRKHGLSLRVVIGAHVERAGGPTGALADVLVDRAGNVVELDLEHEGARLRVPADGSSMSTPAATAA
jgi:sporulation protein YlmC with PRC-barrel domain